MKNIYLVGIKGVGMMALAVYLKEQGKNVWGSDIEEEFPTDAILKKHGIKILEGFDPAHISGDIDLVITTGAHGGLKNPEVLEAEKHTIPVMTLAQEVGHLMKAYKTKISVCGSHGKTTTSAMIGYVLHELGQKSSHLVGAPFFSGLDGGSYGGTDYVVVEADEFVSSPGVDNTPRFMYQNPDVIVCTNVEHDHPDVFKTQEALEEAYLKFFQKLDPKTGTIIYCHDDARLVELVSQVAVKKKIPYSATTKLNLLIPGKHNLLNANAVLTLIRVLGLDVAKSEHILQSFTGSSRRFEKIAKLNDTLLYDDYAHHPTEIKATIEAVRSAFPKRRLVIVFQSHTYSRTKTFLNEFVSVLGEADVCLVTDIFASAREQQKDVTAKDFERIAKEKGISSIVYCPYSEIVPQLNQKIKKGDVIFTMGAGSLYSTHSGIIEALKKL